MEEEIGKIAWAIWQALSTQGELSLTQVKNQVKAKAPFFDWAIGWLAREDQIVITPEKRSFRIRLRENRAKATAVVHQISARARPIKHDAILIAPRHAIASSCRALAGGVN